MDWKQLTRPCRLGCPSGEFDGTEARSEFHRDFDRIIFSPSFRRLNGKTQVVPFPESDITHTRLTHSLETASVGRSLGNMVKFRCKDLNDECDYDIGALVAASCLCHDIGNPPLGHSGESAIKEFYQSSIGEKFLEPLTDEQKMDFKEFDGNSMGFHMLTHSYEKKTAVSGGLGLTYPVLAAYTKYPTSPSGVGKNSAIFNKKPGLFSSDLDTYRTIAEELGIRTVPASNRWYRHPFAYLSEAADDICNSIIDFEDGYKSNLIPHIELKEKFSAIIQDHDCEELAKLDRIIDEREKAGFLRAKAINSLIYQVVDHFVKNEETIICGKYKYSLVDKIKSKATLDCIKQTSIDLLYCNRDVLSIEIAGFRILSGLLELYLSAIIDHKQEHSKKVKKLIPYEYTLDYINAPYETIMNITAYVCGMTDNYAVSMYRLLTGMQFKNY